MSNVTAVRTARKRVSPASIVASVALFFSLAGTGMAAQHYLISSVSQIKPSVLASLLGAHARAPKPDRIVQSEYVDVPANGGIASTIASCPRGTTVVSGGYDGTGIIASQPVAGSPSYWLVSAVNAGTGVDAIRAVAVCAPTAP